MTADCHPGIMSFNLVLVKDVVEKKDNRRS